MEYNKTHILHPANKKRLMDELESQFDQYGDQIDRAVATSSKQSRTLTFSIRIDKSGPLPVFEPTIKMVTVDPLRDTRRIVAEDPDQIPLQLEAKPKKAGKKGGKKKE